MSTEWIYTAVITAFDRSVINYNKSLYILNTSNISSKIGAELTVGLILILLNMSTEDASLCFL